MIRWITDNLGTAPFLQTEESDEYCRVDVRSMVDRSGNSAKEIKVAVDTVLSGLKQGERVVVCCDHGISRSNAVAAGALSLLENLGYYDALRIVINKTGEKEIRVEVAIAVMNAIGSKEMKLDENNWLILGGDGNIGKVVKNNAPSDKAIFSPDKNEVNLLDGSILLDMYIKENGIGRVLYFSSPYVTNINTSLGESIVMLKNVLDVCLSNILPVLIVSRWEVFSGYKGREEVFHEDVECRPDGVLGYTAFLCEEMALQYLKRDTFPVLILRSALLYGKDFAPNFVKYISSKAKSDEEIKLHKYENGYAKIDILHIDDWVSACFSLLKKNVSGVFHVGGEVISLHDVATTIIKMTDSKSTIQGIEINEEVACIGLGSSKLRSITGWQTTKTFSDDIGGYL